MKRHLLKMWFFIASIISCNVLKKEVIIVHTQQYTTDYRSKIKIVVPDFSDPEIHKYYKDYSINLIALVTAVRLNDTTKALAAMEKDIQLHYQKNLINKAVCIYPQRMRPADYQREIYLLSQIQPLYNEIKNTYFIKEEIRRMKELFSTRL